MGWKAGTGVEDPFLLASTVLKLIFSRRLLLSAFAKSDVPAFAACQARCHTVHRVPMAAEQQESLPRSEAVSAITEHALVGIDMHSLPSACMQQQLPSLCVRLRQAM